MGPLNDNIFARSPTMFANQPSQLPTPDVSMSSSPFSFGGNGTANPVTPGNHSTTWTPSSGRPPMATNPSRKRSRDETAYEPVEADGSYFPSSVVNTPAPIPEEPMYGEGMTLLNPRTGLSVGAESQTGTWYEEKTEATSANRIIPESDARPELSSRKTQRLDASASKPDDIAQAILPSSPSKMAPGSEPIIDDFTLSLGIGWTKMATDDSAFEAAARGWAKYIDNHYSAHVHGAEILAKSSGLNAYLIRAREGYFLFSEDLEEAKLVGTTWESAMAALRTRSFEGTESLRAVKTPSPEPSSGPRIMAGHFGSAIQNNVNGAWSSYGNGPHMNGNGIGMATPEVATSGMDID